MKEEAMSWDKLYMEMCHLLARKSKDRSTKIGAVIVGPDNEVRSTGYNGMPRGVDDDVEARHERPLKYMWFEHAERNAIYNAARVGTPLAGCVIYVNSLPPCADCARAIIQCGIIEVVYVAGEVPERWREQTAIALEMLNEEQVNVRKYSCD